MIDYEERLSASASSLATHFRKPIASVCSQPLRSEGAGHPRVGQEIRRRVLAVCDNRRSLCPRQDLELE